MNAHSDSPDSSSTAELKSLISKLKAKLKKNSETAAFFDHQMRSPLQTIIASAQILNSICEDEHEKEIAKRILMAGVELTKELGELVDEIAEAGPKNENVVVCLKKHKKTQSLKNKNVLVADDNKGCRESIADLLLGYGCIVDTADNGDDAVLLLDENKYDIAILDWRMPGYDGVEIAHKCIVDGDNTTNFYLLTGDHTHEVSDDEEKLFKALFSKPVDNATLIEAIS